MTRIDKACYERGCACYDDRVDSDAVEVVLAQPEQEQKVDWEKLYRLEVKKKEVLAAKYERDIKPLTKIVPMEQPEQEPVAWMDANFVWACNECGAQEFTSILSESDLEHLACAGCGCDEFHKEAAHGIKENT